MDYRKEFDENIRMAGEAMEKAEREPRNFKLYLGFAQTLIASANAQAQMIQAEKLEAINGSLVKINRALAGLTGLEQISSTLATIYSEGISVSQMPSSAEIWGS